MSPVAVRSCLPTTGLPGVEAALALVRGQIVPPTAVERIALHKATGRVLASDVRAAVASPAYERSAMDGFAYRFADAANAVPLTCIGRARAGSPFNVPIAAGECVSIATGAMLPPGCDTVVMHEQCAVAGKDVTISGPVIQGQNIRHRGEDFMAGANLLTAGIRLTLGIAPGKAFKPSPRATAILGQSVLAGRAQMELFFETWGPAMMPFWPDRRWGFTALPTEDIAQFSYETPTTLYLDDRAGGMFYGATFLPKSLQGGGTFYLCSLRDSKGNLFKGPNTYRIRVGTDVPARDFWAIVAYDLDSKSYIFNDLDRGGLSSYDKPNMKMNADGSVYIYLAPQAPAGLDANWIPTSGRDFFLFFRFYGPQKAIFDRNYKLPDVEFVDFH